MTDKKRKPNVYKPPPEWFKSLRHGHLARVLFERAQDGYVNPTGGKTPGERGMRGGKDAA